MSGNNYEVLRFSNFKNFYKWDVKQFFSTKIKSSYSVKELGSVIVEQSKKVKLSKDPEKEFGILGVSNEVGMFDAYTEKGKNINQPYKIVKDNFIAYNPYRVNVGSIGIKKPSLLNSFISSAYVVFSTKEILLPDYLFMLMQTDIFNQLIRENTTGSVRQTLGFENLSKIEIPVPPKDVQETLIANYNATMEQAKEEEEKAIQQEKKISKSFFEFLGIKNDKNNLKNKTLLQFFQFSNTSRWDVDYILGQKTTRYLNTSKYSLCKMNDLIINCQYGSSEKADRNSNNIPVLRMNNILNSELNICDLKYLPRDTVNVKKYLLNKNDLLFNRTNSKELVGKTALFDLSGEYVFASYLIRVVLNENLVNPKYINYIFGTPIIRDQIDLISRHILGQANVNVDELKNFLIPLPPIEIQNEIVKHIDGIKKEIKTLREQAQHLRQKAKKDFEESVFDE